MERKWRALIIVCVAIFMLLLDITVVNVALPSIQRDLHTSLTDLEWVVDAYALMLASCTLNAGLARRPARPQARLHLRGRPLHRRLAALRLGHLARSSSNLARGLQGVGGAIMFAVSLAILTQEFHGRERGTAFGIWGATVGAAVAIGPLVGGALTEWAGWRWIFFVNLPIGVACVAGAMGVPARVARRGARRLRLARLRRSSPAASSRSCSRCCAARAGAGAAAGRSASSSPPSSLLVVLRRRGAAAEVADVRLRALPQAVVHRRADRRVHDLVLDVRDVPLPDALHPGAAALLADPGGASLPAALAALVRRPRRSRGGCRRAFPCASSSASACRSSAPRSC